MGIVKEETDLIQLGLSKARIASRYAHTAFTSLVGPSKAERTAVMEEDWDTLVLLDACRSDMFFRLCEFSGTFSRRYSKGSTSAEFLAENFGGEQFHDTVYVSANPHTADLADETFHAHEDVYRTDWDDERQTVTPEAMNEAVRAAHESYPHKRIIAHYMQPHYPFLGSLGEEIEHRGYAPDGDFDAVGASIWTQLQTGTADVSRSRVIKAYEENLRLVLEELEPLLQDIDGKVVISADHGNLIGERGWPIPVRMYGHPGRSGARGLIEVPWFEFPYESRRDVTSDAPTEQERDADNDDLEDRLKALGYQ
ncbi:hypothetical protein [Natronococcus sp. JC468]|uniref:hypothetical protein n=1 Tax=Natronococcus sp. JC468 TaxID=1961921 RepID=UPI001ADF7E31|nr:hypothetical protein [Natronococcus sp. JC468]